MELPAHVLCGDFPWRHFFGGNCGQAFSTTSDLSGQSTVLGADSVVALEAGSTANSVCCKWLGRHNSILNCRGVSRAETYPACARFKFGDGRLGHVRCAADIPMGILEPAGHSRLWPRRPIFQACCARGRWRSLVGGGSFLATSGRCVGGGLISRSN